MSQSFELTLPSSSALAGGRPGASFISIGEWGQVQKYVAQAMSLPADEAAIRKALHLKDGLPFDQFVQLRDAFASCSAHADAFDRGAGKQIVALAGDISAYGHDAKVYFKPMLDLLPAVERGEAKAKQDFLALLDDRRTVARENAGRAGAVATGVLEFRRQIGADTTLVGDAEKVYKEKFGTENEDVAALQKALDEANAARAEAEREYAHDVTVAATTPTYAWSLIGLIPAVVVAGVYGKRATDALARVADNARKAEQASSELALATGLLTAFALAGPTLSALHDTLANAEAIVSRLRGAWEAIADDLGTIVQSLDRAEKAKAIIIMQTSIESAIARWEELAARADTFRANAYIRIDEKAA